MKEDCKQLVGVEFQFLGSSNSEDGQVLLTTLTWLKDGRIENASTLHTTKSNIISDCVLQLLIVKMGFGDNVGMGCSCGNCEVGDLEQLARDIIERRNLK